MPHIAECISKLTKGLGRTPPPLSDKGLALTRICIDERLSWVRQWLAGPAGAGSSAAPGWIWGSAGALTDQVEAVGTVKSWHEHYNAACAFALPLLVKDHGGRHRQRDQLANRAVGHLQHATACADSAYIASRRDWLISEDPDLDGLRTHPLFKAFEALYFPAGNTTPRRPRHVQKLEGSRYTSDVMRATAARWEEICHERVAVARRRPDVHELLNWWEAEALLWSLIGRVAFSHRHSRVRLDLVRTVDRCCGENDKPPLDVCFQRYEHEPLKPPRDRDIDVCADRVVRYADGKLDCLARLLSLDPDSAAGPHSLEEVGEWLDRLRNLNGDGAATPPGAKRLVDLCELHSALWDRLAQWFLAESDGAAEAERFEVALTRLRTELRAA